MHRLQLLAGVRTLSSLMCQMQLMQPHPCCRALLIMPDDFNGKQHAFAQYVANPDYASAQ